MDSKKKILDLGILDKSFNTIEGCLAYAKGFFLIEKYTEIKFQYASSNYVLLKF